MCTCPCPCALNFELSINVQVSLHAFSARSTGQLFYKAQVITYSFRRVLRRLLFAMNLTFCDFVFWLSSYCSGRYGRVIS